MPRPLITIAMPFYNSAATLELSIRSLLHQSFGDFELLLCDDGSTDQSLAIARSFADSRVICWSDGRRRRLPARLNECIDRARGAFLARMDADDVAYPDRLAQQLDLLASHPETDLCGGGAMIFGAKGRPLWRYCPPREHEAIVHNPYRGFPVWHPLWMGRIEWFRRWRYNESAWLGQDQELLLRSHRESRFANLPQVLLGYRRERSSLRKLLRYKRLYVRWVCSQPEGAPHGWKLLELLSITSARIAANCVAALGGSNARIGRQCAQAPSADELKEWDQLWVVLTRWYGLPSNDGFLPSSLRPRSKARAGQA